MDIVEYKREQELLVEQAALLMDQVKPGWEQNIDFASLHISGSATCIAGQNGLDYRLLVDEMKRMKLRSLPFISNICKPQWIKEINLRLSA